LLVDIKHKIKWLKVWNASEILKGQRNFLNSPIIDYSLESFLKNREIVVSIFIEF